VSDARASIGRRRGRRKESEGAHLIAVLNLPVPDDVRVWIQAEALRDAGRSVVVICPSLRGHRAGRRMVEGIEVCYFPAVEGRGALGTILEGLWNTLVVSVIAGWLIGRGRIESVQVCNPPDSLFLLLRWATRRGCTTVYDQHDVVPVLAEERFSSGLLHRVFQRMERETIRAADVLITPSVEQLRRIEDLYGRTATLVRTASPVVTESRQDGSGVPCLGYLGVIGEQDGVGDLVEAVALLFDAQRRGFTVRIAGDGPALAAVRTAAEERGVAEVITFEGWLDRAAVPEFLSEIDAMVVPDPPSPFNHLCAMNKVTHAMAAGIPVVYRPLRENSNILGGLGEIAAGADVADFASALGRMLDRSPAQRAEDGEALRERFRDELDWTIQQGRYVGAVSTQLVS
jgi:glycosyltransferase involved in cell wall biosynthesis